MNREATILDRLRSGAIPDEVAAAAASETLDPEELAGRVLSGRAVIPAGRAGRRVRPTAIGEGLSTKVNANIGSSSESISSGGELNKLAAAEAAGTDTVMDLSTGGDLALIRRRLLEATLLPFGTVPIYEAATAARERNGSVVAMDEEDIFAVVEAQAADGVDFMTIHAGLTTDALDELTAQGRLMDVVSRGGAFMIAWMLHHQRENPFFEYFDRLIELLRGWDITLSIGDGLRPGCLADASDRAQISELKTMGRLAARAREAGVQVVIEGPGHVPLQDIEANVKIAKGLCDNAPFYVLGPLVTDVAPGYDHITAAIGGALAGAAGADFLCYVTAAEHLGLPSENDVYLGVIASRIAAHAADIAKGLPGASEWDRRMALARKSLDWQEQIKLAIDPERAGELYRELQSENVDGCSMCGELCAMKIVSDHLGVINGEYSGC